MFSVLAVQLESPLTTVDQVVLAPGVVAPVGSTPSFASTGSLPVVILLSRYALTVYWMPLVELNLWYTPPSAPLAFSLNRWHSEPPCGDTEGDALNVDPLDPITPLTVVYCVQLSAVVVPDQVSNPPFAIEAPPVTVTVTGPAQLRLMHPVVVLRARP
jgi:hypothetical protein